ncbi:MAG: branched-chain amino acid transport system II carrier protein [Alphaproteobacteria bacterium]
MGFVILGAYYAPYLSKVEREQYLATIANLTLGKYAILILAITMFLACLTTAASLSRLFAEFLQKDIAHSKISWNTSILITTIISYLVSLTGFTTISKALGLVLEYIYPGLIILAIASILHKYSKFKSTKESFWISIIIAITCKALLIN